MEEHQKKNTLEESIRFFMPGLIDLLGDQKISWSAISNGLKNHTEKGRKLLEAKGGPVDREATFYSVLVNKMLGKQESDAFFDFFNSLFATLNIKLSTEEKKPLHRMIKNVLNNFDKKYLNFIGELAVLQKCTSTGDYELLNIEEKITEGSNVTADILLRDKTDGSEILIEVINLHLEEREFENFEEVKRHLDLKFTEKYQQKIITPSRNIHIQPVLWYTDHNQLQFLHDFFQHTPYNFERVFDPVALASLRKDNGKFEHRFEPVKTILLN